MELLWRPPVILPCVLSPPQNPEQQTHAPVPARQQPGPELSPGGPPLATPARIPSLLLLERRTDLMAVSPSSVVSSAMGSIHLSDLRHLNIINIKVSPRDGVITRAHWLHHVYPVNSELLAGPP